MVTRKHKSEPVEPLTEFHVLFRADSGRVQECVIDASCLLECEGRLQELHPEAVYWEIGAVVRKFEIRDG